MGKPEKGMVSFDRGTKIVCCNKVINDALDFGSIFLIIVDNIVIIIKADACGIPEKGKRGIAVIG